MTGRLRSVAVLCLLLLAGPAGRSLTAQVDPAEAYPRLFEAVQMDSVFPDSKEFPDCVPLLPVESIRAEYDSLLRDFVVRRFTLPGNAVVEYASDPAQSVSGHIEGLWDVLTRAPGGGGGSLISLPHAYVVPGGRFREVYYWDSYFTMLGLRRSGRIGLIRDMVDNFSFLIDTLGFIPNGNRTYYTTRSQPPFYAMMVRLLADIAGDSILSNYLPELLKEYAFWMEGSGGLDSASPAHRRVVLLPDGSVLNRYWDDSAMPRPESFREDRRVAEVSGRAPAEVYRDIRAAAESGWDFSSRWFRDGRGLPGIHTTDIIPVDLNSLMVNLETTIADAYRIRGDREHEEHFRALAARRSAAIGKYCWDAGRKFYADYDFRSGSPTGVLSLAAMYPLFFNVAPEERAREVAGRIERDFLAAGGFVTTLSPTGEQWDAPNGWAPLQWITVGGLNNYGLKSLAREGSGRWLGLNEKVYRETGKMMEKYNVVNLDLEAGGGEYDLQDGFGWTNGVYLQLQSLR